jgi:hypothetical protein
MIRARLDIPLTMRENELSRTFIHQLTQVPEEDLALWKKVQSKEESDAD